MPDSQRRRSVTISDTRMDPAQPSLFEKKKNMCCRQKTKKEQIQAVQAWIAALMTSPFDVSCTRSQIPVMRSLRQH